MKSALENAEVWGGVNSPAEKGYSLSPTSRLYLAVTYKAAGVGNDATDFLR